MTPRLLAPLLLVVVARVAAQEPAPASGAGASLPGPAERELSAFEPSVRDQLRLARERALRTPSAETLGGYGLLLHAYDQYERAAACYVRATEMAPGQFQWRYYLAVARADAGDADAAIDALRAALRIRPEDVPARLKLAELLLGRGAVDESHDIYADLVRQHPALAVAHHGLARALAERGGIVEAVEHHRRALELFPQYGASHYALGMLLRKLGQRERSAEHVALYEANRTRRPPIEDPWLAAIEAQRIGPHHLVTRGRALQAEARHREAIELFLLAVHASPDLVQAHVNLVASYAATGAFDRAEAHYRQVLALAPDLAENHYNYGVLLIAQGRAREAAEAFRRTLATNASQAEAHNNLGYLLVRDGQRDEAVAHFRKALAVSPGHRDAHFNLARTLQSSGNGAEALEHFRAAVAVNDDKTPTYLYYLADAYARQGGIEEAMRYAMAARTRAAALGQAALVRRIDDDLARLKNGVVRR